MDKLNNWNIRTGNILHIFQRNPLQNLHYFCIIFFLHNPLHNFFRNSFPKVFLGKVVQKICSKFTGEQLCRSVISIKVALQLGVLINLLLIFRTPFYKNTYGGLLLFFWQKNGLLGSIHDIVECSEMISTDSISRFLLILWSQHNGWMFPLRFSLVNVNKFVVLFLQICSHLLKKNP